MNLFILWKCLWCDLDANHSIETKEEQRVHGAFKVARKVWRQTSSDIWSHRNSEDSLVLPFLREFICIHFWGGHTHRRTNPNEISNSVNNLELSPEENEKDKKEDTKIQTHYDTEKEQFKRGITTTKNILLVFFFFLFSFSSSPSRSLSNIPFATRELSGVRSLIECLRRSLVEQNENKVYAYIRHTYAPDPSNLVRLAPLARVIGVLKGTPLVLAYSSRGQHYFSQHLFFFFVFLFLVAFVRFCFLRGSEERCTRGWLRCVSAGSIGYLVVRGRWWHVTWVIIFIPLVLGVGFVY